jgi:hypothetical protein
VGTIRRNNRFVEIAMRAESWTRRDWMQMITRASGLALLAGCGGKTGDHKIGDVEGSRVQYGADKFQFGDSQLPNKSGPYPVAIVIHGLPRSRRSRLRRAASIWSPRRLPVNSLAARWTA